MIRYKKLLTFKVIDRSTGETIGKILDLIYTNDYKAISHVIIKNDNLIKNKALIPYEDVYFLDSSQALYLKNKKNFEDKLGNDTMERFKYIDKEIKNKNEECIGYVKDIIINKKRGTIEGFIITEGVFEDLLKGRNYIPLLNNVTIDEDCVYISHNDLKSN